MVPIIVSILVSLLLYFLNKASKQNVATVGNGSYELRMNTAYLITGAAGAIVGFLFLLLPILADKYSVGIFMVAGIMSLGFIGFSIPCFLWYKNHHVSFDEAGLTAKNAYGKSQQMKWDEINQVRFSPFMGVLYVVDKNGNTAKAHQHLVGFASFIKMLQIQKDRCHFASESLLLKTLGLSN
jgi:hypothetical protein